MAEDDNVIFKNSQLYEHLKETGFEDLDVHAENVATEEGEENQRKPSSYCGSDFSEDAHVPEESDCKENANKAYIKSNIKQIVNTYLWDDNSRKEVNQLHHKEAESFVEAVLQSPVLEDEDAAYIDSFAASIDLGRGQNAEQEDNDKFFTQILAQMGVLGIALAYGFFRMVYMRFEESSHLLVWGLDVIAVALTVICLMPATVRYAWAGRVIRKLIAFRGGANSLLGEIAVWDKLTRRTIRLLQEKELVARGFTMVSPKTPIHNLEGSGNSRQCPKLRSLTFLTARGVMLDFKEATNKMIKSFPSHVELEGVSSYLASMPLKDYGPVVNLPNGPQLEAATDAFCLTAIKEMVSLCNTHISEFLRVLSLACMLRADDHCKNIGFIDQFEVLNPQKTKLVADMQPLHRLYYLHKSLAAREDGAEAKRQKSLQPQTPLAAVYIAIHSLNLHLQAALKKVQATDQQLGQLEESDETDLSHDLGLTLTSDLKAVASELEACKDCLDEGISRVDRALGRPDSTVKPSEPREPNPASDTETSKSAPLPLFGPEGEPIIVDQVFEAYTDPTVVVDEDAGDDGGLSLEEKIKQKRERQEAIRVLKELRSVIAVRAADREVREQEALKRQYGDDWQLPASMESQDKIESQANESCNSDNDDLMINNRKSNVKRGAKTINWQEESSNPTSENNPDRESVLRPNLADLKHKLSGIGGGDFAFSSSIAAMAVEKSHQMAALSEDTFGADGEMEFEKDDDDDND